MREICKQGPVEVNGICSNPPPRLRRLFQALGANTFCQVSGPTATPTASEQVPDDRIPYYPRRHLSASEIDEIIAGYLAGSTARELGDRWGVHRSTVAAFLKGRGVKLRNRPLDEAEVSAAIRLYQSGLSLATVGDRLDRDPNSVRLVLLKAGISRRDSHGRALL
jgi:hypothetical protein